MRKVLLAITVLFSMAAISAVSPAAMAKAPTRRPAAAVAQHKSAKAVVGKSSRKSAGKVGQLRQGRKQRKNRTHVKKAGASATRSGRKMPGQKRHLAPQRLPKTIPQQIPN